MRPYPETHQQGTIAIENVPDEVYQAVIRGNFGGVCLKGDFGVQIAADGRVWVCINGVAFVRFSPHPNGKMAKETR